MMLIWAWLLALPDPRNAEGNAGNRTVCPEEKCGSNGTAETGLVRPATVRSVALDGIGGCSELFCGNGTALTGLTRPARVASVALPVR
jgi:hypothetical protein